MTCGITFAFNEEKLLFRGFSCWSCNFRCASWPRPDVLAALAWCLMLVPPVESPGLFDDWKTMVWDRSWVAERLLGSIRDSMVGTLGCFMFTILS